MKKVLKKPVLISGAVQIAVFVTLIFFVLDLPGQSSAKKSTSSGGDQTHQILSGSSSEASAETTVLPEFPTRLKIPRIKVDAAVERIGLTAAGDFEKPDNVANVAWYQLGPRPGEPGDAIMNGHFGWKNGVSTVFNNLNRLLPGDLVLVENDQGSITSFMVREVRRYNLDEDVTKILTSSDGLAHLNLLTFEGILNPLTQDFSNRLVVFTDKVVE